MKRKQKTVRPHGVFVVVGEGDNAFWTKIGAASEHKDSKGFNILLTATAERPRGDPRAEVARCAGGAISPTARGELDPGEDGDWTNFYVSAACGRIFDQDTLEVVGRNLRPVLLSYFAERGGPGPRPSVFIWRSQAALYCNYFDQPQSSVALPRQECYLHSIDLVISHGGDRYGGRAAE